MLAEYRFHPVVACLYVMVLLTLPAFAQTPQNLSCSPMAVARIAGDADDNVLASLQGNIHPLALADFDEGVVDESLPLEHIIMMLRRSPDQETALATRIDQMHNQRSPYYHQWLSAEDVGRCFGVADSDIAVVTDWLQRHGFTIDTVPAGKTMIVFSGTAGQVRDTFHTEIHNLNVRGEQHIANMSEPQIPAALAPVIAGFRSLHNFFSQANMHMLGPVKRDSKTGKWQLPDAGNDPLKKLQPKGIEGNFTFSNGGNTYYGIGPQDLYTIYNESPLLTATTPINGAGQTLAVVERNDITQSDVTTFRSAFGLPTYPTTPNATQGGINYLDGISGYCTDPGLANTDDQGEATLDVEWVGVTAPNAIIDYVSCMSTSTSDGTDLSLTYVINDLASSVSAVSSSYGGCEAGFGSQGAAFYASLFGQAVAEGQTVVVAAGDSGSDACDRGNGAGPNGQDLGETGLSVQAQSSSQYAVAAGGSDFSDLYQNNSNPTSYWNTTNGTGLSSALKYIPETAWNDTCTDTLIADWVRYTFSITYPNGPEGLCNDSTDFNAAYPLTTLGGGTGGISTFVTLPTWQSVYGVGLSGNFSSTTHRNLPDVSLYAAIGFWSHFLLFCDSAAGACDFTNGTDAQAQGIGGTSAVAPMLTGIIGLINQAWPSGNPAKPTRQGQANYTFYALAAAEYGTPGTENTSTTAPSVYTCESNYLAISTYSGIFPSCVFHDINRTPQFGTSTCVGTNNAACLVDNNGGACAKGTPGCYTNTTTDLYGILSESTTTFESAFNQSAGYSAATGLGSVNIANLVTNWTKLTPQFTSTTSLVASPTSITSGSTTALTATVTATGRGSLAPPLGTVNFYKGTSCTGTALGAASLVPPTSCASNCGANATLPGVTGAQLGTGSDSVVACFAGDGANDASSTSSAVIVTVTAGGVTPTTTTLSLSPATVSLGSTGPVVMTATVTPTTGTGTPTGSVNFFGNGTFVGSGTPSSGTATFNYNPSTLAAGTYSITAQYGGDSTFASSTSSAQQLTVQSTAPTTITLTLSRTSVNVGSSGALVMTAKVAPTTGTGTPTGSVTFFVNTGTAVGTVALSSGTATFSYNPSGLRAGIDNVTASYLGDSNFATSTSTTQTLSVQDFTMAANSTTITVTDGQTGTSTLTITPLGGFNQTLNYSCSGVPSESNCTFTSAGANSETVSISTTAPSYARSRKAPFGRGGSLVYALLLPGLLGLVLPASRRKRTLRHALSLLFVVAVLTLWLPACGSSSTTTTTPNPGTPKGTYTLILTASTSGAAGTLSHTSTISLTVQ